MSRSVKLYDLAGSPNNIKVRLALALKKIPYERIPVDFQDRAALVKVSGQPLAPVLVHGDTVVYDSYAILRYLDANWPSPPRLYSAEREAMRSIEQWEMFTRTEAAPPVGTVFRESGAKPPDRERIQKANDQINRAASRVEEALAERPYLTGEAPNAADLTVAPMLYYSALPESLARTSPLTTFFYENLQVQGSPRTRDWIARVMSLEK